MLKPSCDYPCFMNSGAAPDAKRRNRSKGETGFGSRGTINLRLVI
jgi:hypothetical protein